jgi:COP9 signalosome complex subunit 3
LVHKYTEICVKNGFVKRGMRFLLQGLNRFEVSKDTLTVFHCNYLLLCLKSINFKAGLTLLQNKISDIDQTKTGVEPKDMLLYYYYGGMIYIGVKDFQKAEYFFDVALTVPCFALNAIMVEAYKKFVLVQLLNYGHVKYFF